jgi:hypothetical protein
VNLKKPESVTYVWITGGSEESINYSEFIKCCNLHYHCGPICSTAPHLSPSQAVENNDAGRFKLLFQSQIFRKFLKTYSESSFPGCSNDTNFRSLGLL